MNMTNLLKGLSIGLGGAGLVIGSLLSDRQTDEAVERYFQKKEEEEKKKGKKES